MAMSERRRDETRQDEKRAFAQPILRPTNHIDRLPLPFQSTRPQAVGNSIHALFVEGLGTAILVFALFVWTHRRNPVPGAAVPVLVGMVYALLQAGLGPLTG
jgi:glycerol uptake facilitator-like aquaporin